VLIPAAIRQSPGYFLLPILDGAAIKPDVLKRTIDGLLPGSTYIHCAQGHGRTGMFCAALLIRRLVDTVSMNGNYLLNLSPDAEGVIDQDQQDRAGNDDPHILPPHSHPSRDPQRDGRGRVPTPQAARYSNPSERETAG
jgi:hypothetical protein